MSASICHQPIGTSVARPRDVSRTRETIGPAAQSSRGGQPPDFDEERYKKRDTVERAINNLKHTRAVATRYDERGHSHLGTVSAAALASWLRSDRPDGSY
ncbi:hypothetical protein GCM10009738_00070 [Kitasatospora viridis]